MTQVAAIAMSLLKGDVLSIMNGFQLFSCTNLPRELSRSIEAKFGVTISKDKVVFKSKYGNPGYYFRYRLNKTEANASGIAKMKTYIQSQLTPVSEARTPKERTLFQQQELFIKTL
jgi:hypothetical protein